MPDRAQLEDEEEIIWLEDPTAYPYLREQSFLLCNRRRGKPGAARVGRRRLIGYANLRSDCSYCDGIPQVFSQRWWVLKEGDPYDEGYPIEAVEPLSVVVGQPSIHMYEIEIWRR